MGVLHDARRDGAKRPTLQGSSANRGNRRPVLQQTLRSAIHCSGIGLHSGVKISMTLHPGDPNSGIVFRRSDLAGAPEIPATWHYAVETPLCTTLESAQARVATVEHLLSALAGMGIDNLLVEVDGPEVPIMDGSAAPFVFLIECAGVVEQDAPRRALRIERAVSVGDDVRSARLLPTRHGFSVGFEIDFDSAVVAHQEFDILVSRSNYKMDIARARTFGFLAEVDHLREAGLARGGSLDNAVVIASDGVLNEGGLRYKDEFVRHKILDSLGDLYLAGGPIIGRFEGIRAGHALNLRLLRALFADPEAWSWGDMTAADLAVEEGGGARVPKRAVAATA